MIEHPGPTGRPLGLRDGCVQIRIYVKTHDAGLPLDGIEMKIIRELLACRKTEGIAGVARGTSRARPVE